MNVRKGFTRIILFLSVILFGTCAGYAQQAPSKSEAGSALWQSKLMVKGKIGNNKSFGGYYLQGEDPARAFFIVNQNSKVLKKLSKSGKSVSIEGTLKEGADNLFIEKINDRPYQGDVAAKPCCTP